MFSSLLCQLNANRHEILFCISQSTILAESSSSQGIWNCGSRIECSAFKSNLFGAQISSGSGPCRSAINTRNKRTTNKLIESPTQPEDLFASVVRNKSVPSSSSATSLKVPPPPKSEKNSRDHPVDVRLKLYHFGGFGGLAVTACRPIVPVSAGGASGGREIYYRTSRVSFSYQFVDLLLLLTKISLNWCFYWRVLGKFYMLPKNNLHFIDTLARALQRGELRVAWSLAFRVASLPDWRSVSLLWSDLWSFIVTGTFIFI